MDLAQERRFVMNVVFDMHDRDVNAPKNLGMIGLDDFIMHFNPKKLMESAMLWKLFFLFLLLIGMYLGFKFLFGSFKTVEEPIYHTIFQKKPYEIREYEEMDVVAIQQYGTRKHALRSGFKHLFAYLSGHNLQNKKINMTAPVLQMGVLDEWMVEFVLPRYLEPIPQPLESSIRIQFRPRARYAVIRFSGRITKVVLERKLESIKDFIIHRNCTMKKKPIFAFYNPPWTPFFLKRHEIWIEVEEDC